MIKNSTEIYVQAKYKFLLYHGCPLLHFLKANETYLDHEFYLINKIYDISLNKHNTHIIK